MSEMTERRTTMSTCTVRHSMWDTPWQDKVGKTKTRQKTHLYKTGDHTCSKKKLIPNMSQAPIRGITTWQMGQKMWNCIRNIVHIHHTTNHKTGQNTSWRTVGPAWKRGNKLKHSFLFNNVRERAGLSCSTSHKWTVIAAKEATQCERLVLQTGLIALVVVARSSLLDGLLGNLTDRWQASLTHGTNLSQINVSA